MRPSPVQAALQDDPTVMGRVGGALPIESLFTPTSDMRAPPNGDAFHPADTEQSTLAIDPHAATMSLEHLNMAQPGAAGTTRLPKFSEAEEGHDRTVMMSARPAHLGGLPSPIGAVPPPPQSSSPRVGSAPSYPELPRASYPDLSRVPQPAPSSPQIMPYQAQAPVPAPPRSAPATKSGGGFGNVLVFIAVAGITMVVVILTGLVVIVGTE
jgi:hypothetical protein